MKNIITIFLFLVSCTVSAEILKFASPTESGIQFVWWPKVTPPKHWHVDEGSSHYFSFNAIAPDGSTFSNAEAVLYAKANFKPRSPEIKNLRSFIQEDIASIRQQKTSVQVVQEKTIFSGSHKPFQVIAYNPISENDNNWERVAYGEDDEYYITFVISSRSKSALNNALPAFASMISSYKSEP
ncbi:MAG: hypothetical protein KGO49_08910 [Gammaproteobacteria bacterium]|nr:hypothetical protein [Gammaproteobacteria bacterium]